jgi:hypothetical protein
MKIRTCWMPDDPLPAGKAVKIREVLKRANIPQSAADAFIAQIGRAYTTWTTCRYSDKERLTDAERQAYIKDIASTAERLQSLLKDMPQEVMTEVQYLLDGNHVAGQASLALRLEKLAYEFLPFQIAAARMKHKPPPRKGPARTQHALHMNLAEAAALELESIGIKPTATRGSVFEEVLSALTETDPHRIAMELLKSEHYQRTRMRRGYIEAPE